MIKPEALKKGDKICIVSPSSEVNSFPRRLQRAMNSLKDQGFKVVLSENALNTKGKEAGSPEERASDLMQAFQDPSVKCIMASTGGFSSNTVLEHLDYDVIKENPKIVVGFSDITALLNAIHHKTGLVTFHGPSLLPSFGDAAGVHKDTMSSFLDVIGNTSRNELKVNDFSLFSEVGLIWDEEDDEPQGYEDSSGLVWLSEGEAQGRLLGGNLDTLLGVLSSSYCPNFSDSILLLEEAGGTVAKTVRNLKSLELAGVFDSACAVVYARPFQYDDNEFSNGLTSLLKELGNKFDIPVLFNVPFGHTEPKMTLPIGVYAKLNSQTKKFEFLSSAVL